MTLLLQSSVHSPLERRVTCAGRPLFRAFARDGVIEHCANHSDRKTPWSYNRQRKRSVKDDVVSMLDSNRSEKDQRVEGVQRGAKY